MRINFYFDEKQFKRFIEDSQKRAVQIALNEVEKRNEKNLRQQEVFKSMNKSHFNFSNANHQRWGMDPRNQSEPKGIKGNWIFGAKKGA